MATKKPRGQDDLFFGLRLDAQQQRFRDAVMRDDVLVVGCNAKAGTGKTLLAVACANILVQSGAYERLNYFFAAPQENKLGFRPGTQEQKEAAYFDPLCDALMTIGEDPNRSIQQLASLENAKNGNAWIDARSHTFMRGVNFKSSFVIVDEAQNFTGAELKKVLTRVHDDCKVLLIGHSEQCDIDPRRSGFAAYLQHYASEEYFVRCDLSVNHRGRISSHADALVL